MYTYIYIYFLFALLFLLFLCLLLPLLTPCRLVCGSYQGHALASRSRYSSSFFVITSVVVSEVQKECERCRRSASKTNPPEGQVSGNPLRGCAVVVFPELTGGGHGVVPVAP